MRLDSHEGAHGMVWDCERCQPIQRCRWVDDVTHELGIIVGLNTARTDVDIQIQRVRRVLIVRSVNPVLVLVNPHEDVVEEHQLVVEMRSDPVPA